MRNRNGRLFRNAGYLAGLLVGVLCLITPARALDPTTCGYGRCHIILCTSYYCGEVHDMGSYDIQYKCDEGPEYNADDIGIYVRQRFGDWGPWSAQGTNMHECDCATVAPVDNSAGFYFPNRPDGGQCVGGCLMVPAGDPAPRMCFGGPEGSTGDAARERCNAPGGLRPDGANCDSFSEETSEDAPPEACDGEDCIKGDPGLPPSLCAKLESGEYVCTGPDSCSGDPLTGFTCVGDPPPLPPPPPATEPDPPPARPDETGEPDLTGQCEICMNGVCRDCTLEYYKGPDGFDCPTGTHHTNPNDPYSPCVVDEPPLLCPDGNPPVNGQCVAPFEDCPDGSAPVDGRCNPNMEHCPDGSTPVNGVWCPPGGEGQCPDGSTPVNGFCANAGECPGGAPPVGGTCGASSGTCPGGAQPVDGMCGTGQGCDPETDPEQCTGDDAGLVTGGQSCDAAPTCTGDIILCAVVRQQWETRCAIENLGDTIADGQGEDGEPIELEILNPEEGGEGETPGDIAGVVESDGSALIGQISDDGFLGGGSCPSLPSFSAFGHTFSFSDQPWWCDFLSILGMIILAMGAFMALQILME